MEREYEITLTQLSAFTGMKRQLLRYYVRKLNLLPHYVIGEEFEKEIGKSTEKAPIIVVQATMKQLEQFKNSLQ
jgi:hypothetical protein